MIVGFIGGGNMAEALIKGLTAKGIKDLLFYDPSEDRIQHLMRTYGAGYVGSNLEVAKRSGIVLIAVKPQIISPVLEEIASVAGGDKIFVSIAAGIRLSYLSEKLKTKRLIRVMPNTPALVQEGMSVISVSEGIGNDDLDRVRDIFQSLGDVLVMSEDKMDAVTALSGSGPGFIAFFVESMIKGGVAIGLSEEESSRLAVQTLFGSAKMLKSGLLSPTRLREMVTSPNGTTYAGLNLMCHRDFQNLIIDTLKVAKERAEALGMATT